MGISEIPTSKSIMGLNLTFNGDCHRSFHLTAPPVIYQVEIGKVVEKDDVKVMRVHQAIDTEFITNDLA